MNRAGGRKLCIYAPGRRADDLRALLTSLEANCDINLWRAVWESGVAVGDLDRRAQGMGF